ncbi:MAG: hypothetical protein HN463_10980 [Gemmatimonadales bacterium]|nr:hypothetical protein [Gemmatimonadales bacterium]MBT4913909.1 hypothetical protein [Gemmatimonadales bacterium]MBT6376220.1 hypothetical protein [Gemmatimonadales bacterium]
MTVRFLSHWKGDSIEPDALALYVGTGATIRITELGRRMSGGRRMDNPKRTTAASTGAVAAALGSALCCGGPVVAVSLGVSSAGLSVFEPYRPYMLGVTAFFLLVGFVTLDHEERAACQPGVPCADASTRRRMKIVLWSATAVAVLFATFPRWQTLIF